MLMCATTISRVALVIVATVSCAAAQTSWPSNAKTGCALLNKANDYRELTTVCSSAQVEAYCTRGEDPQACARCSSYDDPVKPFPSLTQCYKFNQKSCCKSGHDSYIKDEYSSLLSTTCLREYPDLEYYYCLGCSDKQMRYVDLDNKVIHVCPSFADRLWKVADYDRCGLKVPGGDASWPFVLPRSEYANATEFLNTIKPPFFSGAQWSVVVDTTNGDNCFTDAGHQLFVSLGAIIVAAAFSVLASLF